MQHVLVPVKGERADDEAFRLACTMAREHKGTVYVLYVIEVGRDLPLDAEIASETARGEEVLRRMEHLGKEYKCHVEAEILQARGVGPAVVEEAVERQVQMIVLGMPYKMRYGAFSLGDTVPYVLKYAPCRVLVWRE